MGRDLKDRDRLWRATETVPGCTVAGTDPERLVAFLSENHPVAVVVVDLDDGGTDLLDALAAATERGVLPRRVVGYFSHVREDIGRAAAEAGVEAYPRSRFWRELEDLLARDLGP